MMPTLNDLLAEQGVEPKPAYSLAELAFLFRVSMQSIRLYIKQGRLHAWKTSPQRWGKVPHEEVERFFLDINRRNA